MLCEKCEMSRNLASYWLKDFWWFELKLCEQEKVVKSSSVSVEEKFQKS